MPKYRTSTNTNEQTELTVTWEDDNGNLIVAGKKLVKGGQGEAKKAEKAFANDLKRNFADRFPPAPQPQPADGELI